MLVQVELFCPMYHDDIANLTVRHLTILDGITAEHFPHPGTGGRVIRFQVPSSYQPLAPIQLHYCRASSTSDFLEFDMQSSSMEEAFMVEEMFRTNALKSRSVADPRGFRLILAVKESAMVKVDQIMQSVLQTIQTAPPDLTSFRMPFANDAVAHAVKRRLIDAGVEAKVEWVEGHDQVQFDLSNVAKQSLISSLD